VCFLLRAEDSFEHVQRSEGPPNARRSPSTGGRWRSAWVESDMGAARAPRYGSVRRSPSALICFGGGREGDCRVPQLAPVRSPLARSAKASAGAGVAEA